MFPPPTITTISNNNHSQSFNLDNKISPTIIIIIIILSIIFFISGLLHLLIRLILKPIQRNPDELIDNVTVLQGQLQQLFHLHDSGVDQSYIDTLPVFFYKEIIGLKDPFDCAVCLCEFDFDDKLRLLPKCSHAFHMDCIDTWLLSHSTCPLCRSSLLLDYGGNCGNNHNINPIVCVLESGSVENSREINGGERISVSSSNYPFVELGSGQVDFSRKSCDSNSNSNYVSSGHVRSGFEKEKIVVVKLGKFRNVDVGEGTSENGKNNTNNNVVISNGNDDLGSRRCFSMGAFSYVLDETTSLQVPIRNTPMKKKPSKKTNLPFKQGYRQAMSEYGCDSNREFNGIEAFKTIDNLRSIDTDTNTNTGAGTGNGNGNGIEKSKRMESFSISKIWARNKKGNEYESSRRTNSEFEIDVSELGGGDYEETQSCYSIDSLANNNTTSNSSSNTRRTLLWLMGRQNNKIVHNHSNSLSSNV